MKRWGAGIACVVFGMTACQEAELAPAPEPARDRGAALEAYRSETAQQVAGALVDPGARERLVAELRRDGEVSLTSTSLGLTGMAAPQLRSAGSELDAVPELWLHDPQPGAGTDELLVAYPPAGDESTWTEITAYTLDGRRVALDPEVAPPVPVVVVETNGRQAMLESIRQANRLLAEMGLQRGPVVSKTVTEATGARWTVLLDKIRVEDDQEPWILGRAEMYAVASGVIGNNEPQLRIVDLPYLDYDKTVYTPHQIILDWTDYEFQVGNIQIFEHDEGISYQELVVQLIAAVGAIGNLAGYPVIGAIAEIANRVIQAMPSSWFSNDDDYVDSIYTVEKFASYNNRIGAANNVSVTLTPYQVPAN